MPNLKRLLGAFVLVVVLGLTSFADCPVPGQMDTTLPCSVAQATPDARPTPGIMDGPPAVVAVSTSVKMPSLVEVALSALTLF